MYAPWHDMARYGTMFNIKPCRHHIRHRFDVIRSISTGVLWTFDHFDHFGWNLQPFLLEMVGELWGKINSVNKQLDINLHEVFLAQGVNTEVIFFSVSNNIWIGTYISMNWRYHPLYRYLVGSQVSQCLMIVNHPQFILSYCPDGYIEIIWIGIKMIKWV